MKQAQTLNKNTEKKVVLKKKNIIFKKQGDGVKEAKLLTNTANTGHPHNPYKVCRTDESGISQRPYESNTERKLKSSLSQ